MALAVRNERQVTWLKRTARRSLYFKKVPPGRRDMEHETVFHRRNGKCPRRSKFGAAVKGATHAKKMKGFADRVDYRRQFNFHSYEYASFEIHHPA